MLRGVSLRSSPFTLALLLCACTGDASRPATPAERNNVSPVVAPPTSPTAPAAPSAGPADLTSAAAANGSPATTPPATGVPPIPTDIAPGGLTALPPAGTELIPVRLALKDDSVYQVTTLGMVAFTGVQPSGYAREERVELDECSGADQARRCRLTHRYVHFEAEPPNGRIYAADEQRVDKLISRHALLASGAREGDTAVEGLAEQLASPDAQALREVHRFYCLRFPEEPIGVGAKWKDVCHLRTGGAVDTREVIWEFTNLSTDDEGHRRAEFTYVGNYLAPGDRGERRGTVAGMLYFLLDAGEPHLLREKIVTRLDPASSFTTSTTIAYQFARMVKGKDGKETAMRTDGQPFPVAPALPPAAPTDASSPTPTSPTPAPAPTTPAPAPAPTPTH